MTRRGHRTKRIANAITQLPWRDVVNPYGPTEVLNAEQLERIIDGALTILELQGMRFLEPASRQALENAGADVDEETRMVRFDRQLITQMLALAPSEFGLRARNPAHNLHVGGNHIFFASVGGPAFCSDLDKGRRPGTYAEMCDFLRLSN